MGAIAISDHGSVSGVPAFNKAAKSAGLKPIIGCELYLAGDSRLKKLSDSNPTYHMGVIARNEDGYRNLMRYRRTRRGTGSTTSRAPTSIRWRSTRMDSLRFRDACRE